MKRKNLMLIMTLVLMFLMPSVGINADDAISFNKDEYSYVDEDGNIHIYFDAYGNKIKIQDLKKQKYNYQQDNDNIMLTGAVGPANTIGIASSSVVEGSKQKITADFVGPCTIAYGESITKSGTVTGNLSAEIQNKIFNKIKATISVSIAWSSSTSKNFSTTYPVPNNKKGAVYFTPYLSKSNVKYYDGNGNLHNVVATFSVTTSAGFIDGTYELILKNA